jgi:HD-like signal output (HDOD) protein
MSSYQKRLTSAAGKSPATIDSGNSLQEMDKLIDQIGELHSSPTVALKAFNLLNDPDFHIPELERCLEADPALTVAILRLVNSSRFGLTRKVSSLSQAVALLGARSIRLAVLSFGLVERLTRGTPAEVCQDYWRRALTMAVTASRLCRDNKTASSDEAYTAGLLADSGVLLLAQVQCDKYASLYKEHSHGAELIAAERKLLGFDHSALGARLLARWNIPEQLTLAVESHHTDTGNGSYLQRAVLAGDMLADVLWTPGTPRIAETRKFLATEFDLDIDDFITLASECQADVRTSAETFHVTLSASIDCEDLLKRALKQHRSEAMDATLDLDGLTAVTEGDFS